MACVSFYDSKCLRLCENRAIVVDFVLPYFTPHRACVEPILPKLVLLWNCILLQQGHKMFRTVFENLRPFGWKQFLKLATFQYCPRLVRLVLCRPTLNSFLKLSAWLGGKGYPRCYRRNLKVSMKKAFSKCRKKKFGEGKYVYHTSRRCIQKLF